MSDVVELSYDANEVNKIKIKMLEYLTLDKNIVRLEEYTVGYLNDKLSEIRQSLRMKIRDANLFIDEVDNIIIELNILEDKCIKKWNETNLTKEGTEGLCQEQSVS